MQDVIFDRYDDISAKDHEMQRREGQGSAQYQMILTSPLAGRDAIVKNKASIGVNCHNYSAHILSVVMTRMFLYCSCIGARKQTSRVLYRWRWNGYVVHINAIVDAIGDTCKGLLEMHTVSGCYTASYPNAWTSKGVRLASTHQTNLIQFWRGQCYPERHTDNRHCLLYVPIYCQKESTSLKPARHEI